MKEKEREEFYQKRGDILKERMLRRIQRRPDDIIGTGNWENYLWQTWCMHVKWGLCFLIDKKNTLQSNHYMQITHLLSEAWNRWELHPIFLPVQTFDAPHRPYLIRQEVPGRTLDPTSMYDITFAHLAGEILAQQLLALNIQPSQTSATANMIQLFDLKPNNFIIENIDTKVCFSTILELMEKSQEERSDFLHTLSKKWWKIWIFDYGTWLRPDGKGKNQ